MATQADFVDSGDGVVDTAFVQLGGDRETNVGFGAGVDDVAAVEPRVGPQHQRPGGRRGGTHPVERLGQKPGRPPPGMGVAAPQAACTTSPVPAITANSGW